MIGPDDELVSVLDAAGAALVPEVEAEAVTSAVASRVTSRRRRRSAAIGAAVVVAVGVSGIGIGLLDSDDPVLRTVPVPGVGASTTTLRPATGTAGPPTASVDLPGVGAARSLASDGISGWVVRASEEPRASGLGPSIVVRVDAGGALGPVTQLEGLAVLGSAAPSGLWAVVAEATPNGSPAWRVKHIDPTSGRLLASWPVDLDAKPVFMGVVVDGVGVRVWTAEQQFDLDTATGEVFAQPSILDELGGDDRPTIPAPAWGADHEARWSERALSAGTVVEVEDHAPDGQGRFATVLPAEAEPVLAEADRVWAATAEGTVGAWPVE